jgi:hypothetical protein
MVVYIFRHQTMIESALRMLRSYQKNVENYVKKI